MPARLGSRDAGRGGGEAGAAAPPPALPPGAEPRSGRCGQRGARADRAGGQPAVDMDVYRTPAAALDNLVARRLQPSAEFMGAARRALGALGGFLRERGGRAAAQPWRVLKIAKVGAAQGAGAGAGGRAHL